MSTLAVELAFKRGILPGWAAAHPTVEAFWAPTVVLMRRIQAGVRGDVVVLIDASMEALAQQGIVKRESIRPIARAGFGIAVREGEARPDISTPAAFRETIRAARSVCYSRTGASGLYFAELIQRLGIADEVNDRAVIIPAGFTAEKLLSGECDVAVQQISELMSIDGADILGPFPGELQVHTDFSAAIFEGTSHPDAAAFMAHLTTVVASRAYDQGGLASRIEVTGAL
ncbi:molybdate transport system substrate-binding protein [Xaviernesmea oryzae]|uniref:Molybdate transport system substrate-binding protein n=2 Tax=Xaviernesmea oryzae TaxID=464029 RepID=A0A1X7E0V6_9HYPH|nr:molybdate transport system substrate-binding protein [Xaviernesmea oryzae]